MDSFSKRLKKSMDVLDIKASDLSARTGISKSTISRYLAGNYVPKQKYTEKLANALNVTTAWLISGADNTVGLHSIGVKIPVLGNVAAGVPLEAITDIEDYEEIQPQLAQCGEFFALKIKGDSMSPRIQTGDIVIVKRQSDAENGDVAVVLVNGNEATVKEIRKTEDGITLIGWNPSIYTPKLYSKKEIKNLPISIIGKVVEIRAKL